ncbi:MAG: DUF3021 domain-containing protein [Clostridia bacterium]|nr:DUF3021 domain-containing protein [Clostridia bacterium]
MKEHIKNFIMRGLLTASGGPVVLAIIYGVLGATGVADTLSPGAVCKGILTVTVLAFLAGGIGVIYQIERLPLCWAILIHGLVLYAAYILTYLVNGWLASQWIAVAVFTAIFITAYAIIWGIIYLMIRRSTAKLNAQLKKK